jgi:hypothetical protein
MKKIISILLVALVSVAYAQKITVTQGSLAALKDQSEVNMEFTYDNMAVGKFDKEEDYVSDRKDKMNEKEAGTGDKWADGWINDRTERYAPKFYELFNKDGSLTAGEKPDAKYTMIFHTSFTEPGFNVGVMRRNASINADVTVVETANRSNVICKLTIMAAQGAGAMGYDFDTGFRIQECYAVCGKRMIAQVKKAK